MTVFPYLFQGPEPSQKHFSKSPQRALQSPTSPFSNAKLVQNRQKKKKVGNKF